MRIASFAACAALAVVGACSSPEDIAAARATANQVRTHFDAGDADAIYALTTNAYRSVTNAPDTTRMIKAVRAAVGECQPAGEPINTTWSRTTSGYFIALTFTRTCANGPLTETYTLSMDTNPPKLQSFNYNSPALLPGG
jgi:hypothetical protein